MVSSAPVLHLPVLSSADFGLFRTPGPGLGNLLFPIGRALAGARDTGGIFVQPTLRQLKFGTYLRREPDKRTYGDILRHRGFSDWRHWFASASGRSVTEDADEASKREARVVTYAGLRSYFHDLHGARDLIAEWLASRARYEGLLDHQYDVAVHVRLGDFAASNGPSAAPSIRQPMDWYVAAIEEVTSSARARDVRIVVFSDAAPGELRPLIDKFSARVDPGRNAITSLINMSKCQTLITSRSTFSMWAAYLGDVQAIWDEDFDLSPFWPVRKSKDSVFSAGGGLHAAKM